MEKDFTITIKGVQVSEQIGLYSMEIQINGSLNQRTMLAALMKLADAFKTCLKQAGIVEEKEMSKTLKINGKDVKFEAEP